MTSYYYRVGVFVYGQQEPSYNALCYIHRKDAEDSAQDLMSRWTMMRSYEIQRIGQNDVERLELTIKDGSTIKGAGHRCSL